MKRICKSVYAALLMACLSLTGVATIYAEPAIEARDPNNPKTEIAALSTTGPEPGFVLGQCLAGAPLIRVKRLAFCKAPLAEQPIVPVESAVFRYRVMVEKGLETASNEFAKIVATVLNAETGWARADLNFVQVETGEDFTVFLAQPRSVDRLCRPLTTEGTLSCAISGKAVINSERWFRGANTWDNHNIPGYRRYLINHEVGHLLGLGHTGCPEQGMPAPIMLPQTRFLKGCLPNGEISERDLKMISRVMPLLRRRLKIARPGRLLSKPTFRRKRRWYRKRGRGRKRYARRRRRR